MYISRYLERGVILLVAGLILPVIMNEVVSPQELQTDSEHYNPMLSVAVVLTTIVLLALAAGQLQGAYCIFKLNRLLEDAIRDITSFSFTIDHNATATVTRADGRYRIEVVEKNSEDLAIYFLTYMKIEAQRLTGAVKIVHANEPGDFHEVEFEEESFLPNFITEMRRFKRALDPP